MLVNGQEFKLDDLVKTINFEQNMHQKVNASLDLTTYQIEILNRFAIDYQSLSSLKELIYQIENVLEETDDEELEIIASELAERNYYENTNK